MPNQLSIQQVELYKLLIPLKEPFVISLGPVNNAESVIVIIKTNEGITGFGECSPYTSINGESIDTCFIVGQYFAKVLKGKDPLQIKECLAAMDKIIYGNSSIKSAFDMAIHDIAAQHAGVPLYKFLGGENNKTLTTDMTVSIGDAKKMAADALKFKEQGFPAIKVKLGESKEKDVERIAAIREVIGKDIPLRIDANQGWKVKTAIETLIALEEFNIQHCEEPIARWNYMRLGKVRKNSPIEIMADESCGDHHDAKRLIDLEACDSINVKLGKSGGIFTAKKIIGLCEKATMHMQVGAFMESRLGITAAAHLALSSDYIIHCDFDTPLMFTEDPVSGGVVYEKNGVVKVPETAGLGAKIDEGWLGKMEKVII
ncbi:MAG: mandelate racemase/muconate lactonizing enzyme family protein [Chitinophagales bacterium]